MSKTNETGWYHYVCQIPGDYHGVDARVAETVRFIHEVTYESLQFTKHPATKPNDVTILLLADEAVRMANRDIVRISLAALVESLTAKPTADTMGERWKPVAHFTDSLSGPQTPKVKAIIEKYADKVAGYYLAVVGNTDLYSLELQFNDGPSGSACIREYQSLFDDDE